MINKFNKVLQIYNENEDDIETYFVSSVNNEVKYFLTKLQNEDGFRVHIGFNLNKNKEIIHDKLMSVLKEYDKIVESGIIIDGYVWFLLYETGFNFDNECSNWSYRFFAQKIYDICLKVLEDLYNE